MIICLKTSRSKLDGVIAQESRVLVDSLQKQEENRAATGSNHFR
jgi:hypothetical protein